MIVYVDYSTMKEKKVPSPEERQRETWYMAVEGLHRMGVTAEFFEEDSWSPSSLFRLLMARPPESTR